MLHQNHTGTGEDPLATGLEKFALASERVGEARLAQDAQIQSRFLAGWNTTLNTNLNFATRARKNVEKSRLSLDAVKAHAKGTTFKLGPGSQSVQPGDEQELSAEAQEEIEKAEDEFVTQTEEAVGVMKNVRSPPPSPPLLCPDLGPSIIDTLTSRSWTRLSPSATCPSSSRRSSTTTRRPTRFSPSWLLSSRVCRPSKKYAAPLPSLLESSRVGDI